MLLMEKYVMYIYKGSSYFKAFYSMYEQFTCVIKGIRSTYNKALQTSQGAECTSNYLTHFLFCLQL